jgi:hypothetical protein
MFIVHNVCREEGVLGYQLFFLFFIYPTSALAPTTQFPTKEKRKESKQMRNHPQSSQTPKSRSQFPRKENYALKTNW